MKLFATPLEFYIPRQTPYTVSPSLARTWLIQYRYPRQRTVRDYHVRELLAMMHYGTYRDHSVLSFAQCDEQICLLNGTHSLEALCLFGREKPFMIEERRLPTLEEMHDVYESFDRGMSRTYMDMLKGSGFLDEHSVTDQLMQKLHAAVALVMGGFTETPHMRGAMVASIMRDTHHMLDFMTEWVEEAREYLRAISGTDKTSQKNFQRAGVMSVGMLTLRYVPDYSFDFWRQACHKTNLPEGDVRLALTNWIERTSPKKMHPIEYAQHVASAWNGYVDAGGKLRKGDRWRVRRQSSRAFVLHGTPLRGNEQLWFIGPHGEPLHEPVTKPRLNYLRSIVAA